MMRLSVKTLVLLAYVALCTNVVLRVLEAESTPHAVTWFYHASITSAGSGADIKS